MEIKTLTTVFRGLSSFVFYQYFSQIYKSGWSPSQILKEFKQRLRFNVALW
jgi:hypothetical protein